MHDTNGRLIAEVEPNGALRSHFVYASQSNSPDYMIRGGVKYFFVKSHLGSIRSAVNSQTGASSQQLRYDEFGRVLFNSNPGFQPFGFAGGHLDSETGLVRFGARDYDAEVGRWTAKDPILFDGGQQNLYLYVDSDPVNRVDPSGLWGIQLGIGFGGMFGLSGAGFSAGIGLTYSSQHGLQFGGYVSSQWNAGLGISAGRGIQASFSPNACKLSDLGGVSAIGGIDTPLGGMSYSRGAAGSTWGLNVGPSLGGALYGGVQSTQIFPIGVSP